MSLVIPKISETGLCPECGQVVGLERGTITTHSAPHKGYCSGFGRIVLEKDRQYLVENKQQAIILAKFLDEHVGECILGSTYHNGSCGDGDLCNRTWYRLTRALAQFVLNK
jgi:hypothetical protein